MRGALLLIALLILAALTAACREEAAPEPSPTPSPVTTLEAATPPVQTPTPPVAETPTAAVSPSPEGVTCAAGSTQQFLDTQAEAGFTLYCPTFLPEGYELEDIIYGLDIRGAAPEAGVGAIQAQFVDGETGGRISLVQGLPGLSVLASAVRGGDEFGDIPYADFQASLLGSPPENPEPLLAVLGSSEGITHWIEAVGPSEDVVRQIAAQMRALSP